MKRFADLEREERIKKVLDLRRSDLCLVLENLSEDNNISAILRTAEGFGVGHIYIIHSNSRPRLSKNTSSGASKWLEVKYYDSTKKCFKDLKKQKYQIIGALVDPNAKVLWQENFSGRIAVAVGNEAQGLSSEAQKLVDSNIYLPMFGLTESLNVSVATGIFLYEVIRQKEF